MEQQVATKRTADGLRMGRAEMNDVIKVGDTICCHDYADMMDVISELTRQGYIATAQVGYVVRIESVPVADPAEQDGWVTWNK